ncbi:hypothetical protein NKG94_35800 [Micromonospora sp. M12]
MALVDGVRAAVVAALAVVVAFDRISVPVLLVAAFLLAALGTLFDSASFALLPALVPRRRCPGRTVDFRRGSGGWRFPRAPAAGVLFAVAPALPFALDAVTFVAAALLVLALTPVGNANARPGARRGSVWSEIGEGCAGCGHTGPCGGSQCSPPGATWRSAGSWRCWCSTRWTCCGYRRPGTGCSPPPPSLVAWRGSRRAPRRLARYGVGAARGAGRGDPGADRLRAGSASGAGRDRAGFLRRWHCGVEQPVCVVRAAARAERTARSGRCGPKDGRSAHRTARAVLAGLAASAYGTVPVTGAAAGTFALVTLAAWRTLRSTTSDVLTTA